MPPVQTDSETDILLFLEPNEPVLCESYYENVEKGAPPHRAHWYAHCYCGALQIAVCERRRLLCYVSNGWRCTPNGCDDFHPYEEISWTQIPPH